MFERLISSEKINILAKMQPFPEVCRLFAEFGCEFGDSFLFLPTNPACLEVFKMSTITVL